MLTEHMDRSLLKSPSSVYFGRVRIKQRAFQPHFTSERSALYALAKSLASYSVSKFARSSACSPSFEGISSTSRRVVGASFRRPRDFRITDDRLFLRA